MKTILSILVFVLVLTGQQTQQSRIVICTDAGSTDAYACSPNPTVTTYTTGLRVRLYANTANTGAASVNLSSLGTKTITKVGGGIATDLSDNDIRAGQYVELVYDGTNFQMLSQLGNAPSGGGSAFDPLATAFEYDDFYSSAQTTGSIGKLGWNFAVDSGGTGIITDVSGAGTSPANHPGVLAIQVSTTADKCIRIQLARTTNNPYPFYDVYGATNWEFIWVVRTTTLLDADVLMRVGLGNLADGNSALLKKTSNQVRFTGTGNWLLESCDNAGTPVCSTVDTGVTPAQNSWYKIRMYSDTAGTVKAQISTDGGSYSSPVSLTMKSTSGSTVTPIGLIGYVAGATGTATARIMQFDYYHHKFPVAR